MDVPSEGGMTDLKIEEQLRRFCSAIYNALADIRMH